MAWNPSSDNLGTVNEGISVSHTITYSEIDPLTLLETTYPVTITAADTSPTISVSDNQIVGYYSDSFDYTVQHRTVDGELPIVNKFSELPSNVYEMVKYSPNTATTKTFSYTAVAKNGSTVVSTKTYTKTVSNNWTYNKMLLQKYVSGSGGEITLDTVTWINNSGVAVSWENNVNWI